jgi:transcriptional regulator with XRE-family HTH domain
MPIPWVPVEPSTRAHKKLLAWAAADPVARNATRIAELLGMSQPSVSEWLAGKSRPDHPMRLALSNLTAGAVQPEDWLTREESRKVARVKPLRTVPVG